MCENANHTKNRERICLSCLLKADRGRATADEIESFRTRWLDQYDVENRYTPTGLCTGCKIRLHASFDKNKEQKPAMYIGDYELLLPGVCACMCMSVREK